MVKADINARYCAEAKSLLHYITFKCTFQPNINKNTYTYAPAKRERLPKVKASDRVSKTNKPLNPILPLHYFPPVQCYEDFYYSTRLTRHLTNVHNVLENDSIGNLETQNTSTRIGSKTI